MGRGLLITIFDEKLIFSCFLASSEELVRMGAATLIIALMLLGQVFSPVGGINAQASSEVFEGSGPVLQSRIVTQSSSATFVKKG
jgi:hypothetical protein